jgi:hypothetical protein
MALTSSGARSSTGIGPAVADHSVSTRVTINV